MSTAITILTANAKKALKRPFASLSTKQPAMQDSSWADGLRGIASVFVVSSHMVLCFARRLVYACCGDDQTVLLFQRPILRLVAQGQAWVAIFFILSGFVNALKPIKLARAGNVENALSNLALSSFRRSFRLVLPAAAAAIISWFICQLGAYEIARNSDAYWLYTYTPAPSHSWGIAIEDLVNGLRATWTLGIINPYDQPQWALIYLFQGSMMIFTSLLITVNLTPFYRALTLIFFAFWSFDLSYKFRDPLVGFTVFGGILLAEFSISTLPARFSRYSLLLGPPLAIFALVLMSCPSDAPENTPWSATLQAIAIRVFPAQLDYGRFYGSLGGLLLVFSIIISPHLRALLSQPSLLWLGKVSFPIYLLHGTFMRSLFSWLMFAGTNAIEIDVQGADGANNPVMRYPLPGKLRISISVVIFSVALLAATHLWAGKMEPRFGWITRKAEETMMGKGEREHGARPVLPIRKE